MINSQNFETVKVSINQSVAYISINNPPVNVLDVKLMAEIKMILSGFSNDHSVKVIVFESENPDFFIAHVDMSLIDHPNAFDELAKEIPDHLNVFQAFGETVRKQPQITIAKLKGIARGGGAEFIAAVDMSFASIEKGQLAQCEALMGIIPGGGATVYLKNKAGRSRALEIILGADLFDAVTAEKYGWINRAIANDEIDQFVDRLAQNIANLPEGVIAAAKKTLYPAGVEEEFHLESANWEALFVKPNAEKLIRGGLKNGAQTIEGELHLEEILRRLA
ncbi:enoyl-CoA hydratase/isomerase family protein [Chryseobacterium sp. OV279]|uniref:enoyl-CoA hydratase/isomerase family protein n=1 Tax=Chryseobacterium sp. OV279 TaxID=1500285 RepID=UPI00092184DC|nr:enoyl-CoA hydratase/isomerase family protein [Chryseobacterium sp. OV279]SHF61106.1 Enoyl-CoA hydratase/carnithine racemase [Chryseobacterium sp. OV279]